MPRTPTPTRPPHPARQVDAEVQEDLDEFATLSGFLCQQAGEIPEQGAVVDVGALRFEVVEADERRIETVVATNTSLADADAPPAGSDAGV